MMAPFTMDELEDLNIYNRRELDRIHNINKFLIIFTFIIIMFLLFIEFINLM